jgi:hypothetical protein
MSRAREGAELVTAYDSGGLPGMRNRIINGDMRIDQRNNGASLTHSGGSNFYGMDRMVFNSNGTPQFSVQRVEDAPPGFTFSAKLTTTTAGTPAAADFSYFGQYIEGFNVADFAFGTASATTVTISFWVKSSLTGTFGGSIRNGSNNRAYPFSFSINAVNTWEFKTVTVPGDVTGVWGKDNSFGLTLVFDTGSGANNKGTAGAWNSTANIGVTGGTNLVATAGATINITGVQLEKGSTATSFDVRDYGRELALCQRYYVDLANNGGATQNNFRAIGFGSTYSTTQGTYVIQVPVPMRTLPALTQAGTMYFQNLGATSVSSFAGPYSIAGTIVEGDFTMVGAVASNAPGILRWNSSATQRFSYSAEL